MRRRTASLVCSKLRPIMMAALPTVSTGTPTKVWSKRSVAEPALTRPTLARQRSWMPATRCSKPEASSTAHPCQQLGGGFGVHLVLHGLGVLDH